MVPPGLSFFWVRRWPCWLRTLGHTLYTNTRDLLIIRCNAAIIQRRTNSSIPHNSLVSALMATSNSNCITCRLFQTATDVVLVPASNWYSVLLNVNKYCPYVRQRDDEDVGRPYCRTEMYAGRVACCPWWVTTSMRTDGQTDESQTVTLRFLLNAASR